MSAASKIRILLLEDNIGDRVLFEQGVREKNLPYDITHTATIQEAKNVLNQKEFDLIITDYNLPDGTGIEFLHFVSNRIPFIIVTGAGTEKIAVEAMKNGASDYLIKDIQQNYLNILPFTIDSILKKKELERESNRLQEELKRKVTLLEKAYKEMSIVQEQLIQSSKLAAMGEMAAGVTHELAQPLFGIKAYSEVLLKNFNEFLSKGSLNTKNIEEWAQTAAKDLDIIAKQTDRMTLIVDGIRNFAYGSISEPSPIDVNGSIEDALLLFSAQLRSHGISVKMDLAKNLLKVNGNSNQLQQVFINLITNSRDAMDKRNDGKVISISSRLSLDNNFVEIELKDTGLGMDSKTLEQIFNPFFTTKPKGQGTGLGMPIVQRIINEHKGKVEVQSIKGIGTTIKIQIPTLV